LNHVVVHILQELLAAVASSVLSSQGCHSRQQRWQIAVVIAFRLEGGRLAAVHAAMAMNPPSD